MAGTPRRGGGRPHVNRRLPTGAARPYPRAARVNEVLREVLAEAIERLADTDERLTLLTVTAVTSDPELRHATVLFASLSDDARSALTDVRLRLQGLIARQVRLKRTPQLAFALDPALSTGERVEEILRHIRHDGAEGGGEGGQDER
jgi:ribosome-binding factor A